MVQLELGYGPEFRRLAAEPLARELSVPGVRGRILAGGGTVLACDEDAPAVAVHYRYLQDPPDARWLRSTARWRLSAAERKKPGRLAEEEARVLAEREALVCRLAELTGVSRQVWNARAAGIQTRVEQIADTVNRRRLAELERRADAGRSPEGVKHGAESLGGRIRSLVLDVLQGSIDDSPPERITVAEQLDYHVVVEDVSLEVVAEIEAHRDRYPGVKIVQRRRRTYPYGTLAAHLLGHLGPVEKSDLGAGDSCRHAEDLIGRAGVERQYEHLLYGRRGTAVELTDRSGRVLSSYRRQEPELGRDLVLSLDLRLQQAAEELLAAALKRRSMQRAEAGPAGGACVVIDVRSGALLAAASAPSFDPNLFAGRGGNEVESILSDPFHPLFDRVSRMALPPGSVFKIVSAAALLTDGGVKADQPLCCQGYLHSPERWRCAIFRRSGAGHGDVALADALAQSCNVYFFHHAEHLGPEPLVAWGRRFGFGQITGVDLPGEAAGNLPSPDSRAAGRQDAPQPSPLNPLPVAIGQGALAATPLQVVRMMAAVANGGRLVTPHVASHLGLPPLEGDQSTADLEVLAPDVIRILPPAPVDRLDAATLAAIREGLRRTVADPLGTAHATVWLDSIEVAGKTGTAETDSQQGDHAWFAGYAPADRPKVAFVVALEHAGDAAEAAGPVAKRLVLAMQALGYFDRRSAPLAHRP